MVATGVKCSSTGNKLEFESKTLLHNDAHTQRWSNMHVRFENIVLEAYKEEPVAFPPPRTIPVGAEYCSIGVDVNRGVFWAICLGVS